MNDSILDRPRLGTFGLRMDVLIRWLDPLSNTEAEPPLVVRGWWTSRSTASAAEKPVHVVRRLLKRTAPMFDAEPELALAEAFMRPSGSARC